MIEELYQTIEAIEGVIRYTGSPYQDGEIRAAVEVRFDSVDMNIPRGLVSPFPVYLINIYQHYPGGVETPEAQLDFQRVISQIYTALTMPSLTIQRVGPAQHRRNNWQMCPIRVRADVPFNDLLDAIDDDDG